MTAAAGFGCAFLSQIFMPSPTILLVTSLSTGMLFTIHWVASAPFFMRNADPDQRTELFGIASALETLGLRYALAATAIASLLAIIPFSRIRSAPRPAERRSFLAYVTSKDSILLAKLCIPSFLVGCGAGLTIPFLNLYFRERFNQDPQRIGVFFAVAQCLTMAGFLAGPVLARRFSHVRAIVATELLSIPFFLALAIANRLWIAVAAFWIRGALMNMNAPVSSAFSMEIVPPDQQASTNSMRMLAWNLSWMVTTPIGGWLIESHGFAPNMVSTMGLYLIASSLFWIFFRNRAAGSAFYTSRAEQ